MAKLLKLRRGTTTQHGSFTGAEGEVTIDTTKDTAVVHDGSTAGGRPLARQDMNNVPAGTILGTQLENSGVSAGQYGSSSAIPIVTVDAQGLVTAASTTAIDSTTIANGTSSVAVANNGDITTTRSGTARFKVDNGGVVVTGGATISGSLNSGDVTLTSTQPKIVFNDSNDNPDYQVENVQGVFKIRDNTNSADRLVVNTDGHLDIAGNVDFGAGIDVTGNITSTGSLTVDNNAVIKGANDTAGILELHSDRGDDNPDKWRFIAEASGSELNIQNYANGAWQNNLRTTGNAGVDLYHSNGIKASTTSGGFSVTGNITSTGNVVASGNIEISNTQPTLSFTDTNHNPDFLIRNADGGLIFNDSTNAANRLVINSDGHVDVTGNLDVGAGLDVTGNVTFTGSITGDGSSLTGIQPFPSGTKMLFQQTSAPTGWTKVTSGVDNKALRVVSGTAGSGGSNAFSNTLASRSIPANAANATQGGNISVANTTAGGNVSIDSASTGGTVNSHTLTINEIPSHSHSIGLNQGRGTNTNYRNNAAGLAGVSYIGANTRNYTNAGSFNTNNSGGGGGHSHGFTGGSHNHNGTLSGTAHTHNATFTGSAHNHSISVTNLDMAVQYLDVIIAAKD